MPKKTKKTSKFSTRTKFIAVFAGLILIFFGVQAYQQWQTEQKFEKVEKDFQKLEQEFAIKIGEDKFEIDRACYRASRKFDEGPLTCSINIYSDSFASNQKIIGDLSDLVNLKGIFTNIHGVEIQSDAKVSFRTINIRHIATGLNCRIDNYEDEEENRSTYSLGISCTEKSKRSFYPYTGD